MINTKPLNSKQSYCFPLIKLLFIIGFIQSIVGCSESKVEPSSNTTKNIQDSNSLWVTYFPSCKDEGEFLISTIENLSDRIKELKQTYKELKHDQMSWDKYISNYNRYTWELNDSTRSLTFKCIETHYFNNLRSSYGMVGLKYVYGPTKQAKYFEDKFVDFSKQIRKKINEKKLISN